VVWQQQGYGESLYLMTAQTAVTATCFLTRSPPRLITDSHYPMRALRKSQRDATHERLQGSARRVPSGSRCRKEFPDVPHDRRWCGFGRQISGSVARDCRIGSSSSWLQALGASRALSARGASAKVEFGVVPARKTGVVRAEGVSFKGGNRLRCRPIASPGESYR
jgi:hypothetical protein